MLLPMWPKLNKVPKMSKGRTKEKFSKKGDRANEEELSAQDAASERNKNWSKRGK